MAPARRPAAQDDALVASLLSSGEEHWDSSPLKLPGWSANLHRAIPRERGFDALVRFGYVTTRGSVCVSNVFHSTSLASGSYGPFTYINPAPRAPAPSAAAPAAAPPPSAAPVAAVPAGAPAAAAAAVPAPVVASSRYVIAPESIIELDLELAEFILKKVDNMSVRDAWSLACAGSGRELLRIIASEVAKRMSPKAAAAIVKTYRHVLAVGLPVPSVAHFNEFQGTLIRLNNALPPARREPDSILAENLADTVSRISDKVETSLAVEMKLRAAEGNLALTTAVILSVLGDLDADADAMQLIGAGFIGKPDPAKSRAANKTNTARPQRGDTWNTSFRKCRFFPGSKCDGKHFDFDCPNRPPPKQGKQADRPGLGAVGEAIENLDLDEPQPGEVAIADLFGGPAGVSRTVELGAARGAVAKVQVKKQSDIAPPTIEAIAAAPLLCLDEPPVESTPSPGSSTPDIALSGCSPSCPTSDAPLPAN